MKKLISAKQAGRILLIFLSLLLVFHFLLLFEIIPASKFWGGQANGGSNLFIMEVFAIIITIVFIIIIAAKIGKSRKFRKLAYYGVWIIFIYLIFNTLGNFFSDSIIETIVIAPITLIMAFLALRLAIEK